MYSKEDYLRNFCRTESQVLLDRLAKNELTDDARAAIRELLTERGVSLPYLETVDMTDEKVHAHAMALRNGACPRCRRHRGIVELRSSHWVWSALVFTRFKTEKHLCCHKCGNRENFKAAGFCLLLGWWGFPFGLLGTPYMVLANFFQIVGRDRLEPSDALRDLVRRHLGGMARSRPVQLLDPVELEKSVS
ncbi:MAG TPA: hypothetical protein VIM98_01075 [Dyella sp.]|uniref:hypothetical protein n=1 Tax=Dyella sp. TaxID=1869338 RepID=UPI002F92D99D